MNKFKLGESVEVIETVFTDEYRGLHNSINITSDSININVEKEKNDMEILDLYKRKKRILIKDERDKKRKELYDNDEIQKIAEEMFKQINVILENEGRQIVKISSPFNNELITSETDGKIKKLEEETHKKFDELDNLIEEVKAMLSMTNDYQEQIEILKNYGIIDKKTNKLNV